MATERVPLMLISFKSAEGIGRTFKGLGRKLVGFYPGIRYDLLNAKIKLEPDSFMVAAFFSALIWAAVFGLFAKVIVSARSMAEPAQSFLPLVMALGFYILFFFLHIFYPKLIAKRIADEVDRDLVFAVRDIYIQVSSGIPLFTAMTNISEGHHGEVTAAFKEVVQNVRAGSSMIRALEEMAVKTRSIFLKKAAWQLIITIRAGANVGTALKSIVTMLLEYQFNLVKAYNSELNFIVLIYLLVAAVIPTIGLTVMIVFSVFGLLGITQELFFTIIFLSLVAQGILIGYIHTKRPKLYT